MKLNAFCTDGIKLALNRADGVVYCGDGEGSGATTICRTIGSSALDKHIYIPDMTDEPAFEQACDYILNNGAKAIVRAAYDLTEAGIIEARYKLSPVMLLHKLGVAEYCTIAGGVCLDNDDLDLMAQEGMSLIVTPTASAGYGHGFAPICAAVARGIRVGVGTFDNKYNKNADIDVELEFLSLTANAEMRCENALSKAELDIISSFATNTGRL